MIWLGLLICLAVSFVFSGVEAALLSLNRVRLKHLARQKDKAARRLQNLVEQPTRLLVTVLFVTNFLNITALVLLATQMVTWFGPWGYVVTLLIALPLFLLVVELLPKSIFRRLSYRTLASLAVWVEVASQALTPFIHVGNRITRSVLRVKEPDEIFVAREDLKYATAEIERMGMLSSIERQMIHNVVDFRSVKVRDVMVPVEQVVFVSPDSSAEEVVELSKQTQFDRFPMRDAAGKIIGLVNVFDLIVERRSGAIGRNYLRRMLSVGPDEQAPIVLRRLRASPQSLAAVTDSGGQPIGIVSAEDLLSPLVKVTT
jgi:CBS domain containing-hemolysin-like protein